MNTKEFGGGVLAALLLLLALGSRADDKAVVVRPYKPGASVVYKTVILTSAMGSEVRLESTAKQSVKEVKDNGQVVITTEDRGGKTILNGQEQERTPNPPTREVRDKLGKLVDFSPADAQQGLIPTDVRKLLLSLNDVLLTEMAVKAGDSWETVLDNPASKNDKAKVKTTFQGTDKVDGVACLKFKQTAEAVADDKGGKVTEDFTAWINPADGLLQKLDAKVKDIPTQFGPLTFNISFSRLPEEKKEDKKEEKKDEKKPDAKDEKK